MPAVLALAGRYQARGLRVIGTSSLDPDDAEAERKSAEEAAKEERMTWPSYLDTASTWAKPIGLSEIPAFLVVGKDGRVLFRHQGKLVKDSPAYAAMERALDQATNAPSP